MSHGHMSGVTNLEYIPDKHIELITASSNNQIIGRCLFCLDGDTIVKTESGDYKISELAGSKNRFYTCKDNVIILSDYCASLYVPSLSINLCSGVHFIIVPSSSSI